MQIDQHYYIPPLERISLQQILSFIEKRRYFVLHAPRQTGKTSYLYALRDHLNQAGRYHCVYVNVESGQAAQEDIRSGIGTILEACAYQAELTLQDEFLEQHWRKTFESSQPHFALTKLLGRWAAHTEKPIVLFLDEIDALVGDTLISVLRQLRTGYGDRPQHFPQSIILCGVRDVRDYRIHSDQEKTVITGGSAFNIKAESLRLGNFDTSQIAELFRQHTEETGQTIEGDALALIGEMSGGQPWLVNAIGNEITVKMEVGTSEGITSNFVRQAIENIILAKDTHIDQLADKLKHEDRVARVIRPLLAGETEKEAEIPEDDAQYVEDLGLVVRHPVLRIANPIYREVIPRMLISTLQQTIDHKTEWYVNDDGTLNMAALLEGFQQFFRENTGHWVETFEYKEAGPQLLLQAFLQRVVNGGGRIEREYGLGRRRTDLLIVWPKGNPPQKVVMELKIQHKSRESTIKDGLVQTHAYTDIANATESHLIIFDRSPDKDWDEKVYQESHRHEGRTIVVWGM